MSILLAALPRSTRIVSQIAAGGVTFQDREAATAALANRRRRIRHQAKP